MRRGKMDGDRENERVFTFEIWSLHIMMKLLQVKFNEGDKCRFSVLNWLRNAIKELIVM